MIASVDDEGHLRAALRRLKENGVVLLYVNAPPPVLLRLADEEGLLIVEGARPGHSREMANEELRALVLRDRSHPSILGWSLPDTDTSDGDCPPGPSTRPASSLWETGADRTLWPPNQNVPVMGSLPSGLLPAL